ncbi:MAG: hypothetical protein MEQ07_07845 [Aquimonas sp.]|nr:hypothetical protein [Aquimonas sp.]
MSNESKSERMQYCLDAFGSDPARWPPADAAALAALPAAEAAALLGCGRELDDWLQTLPEPALPLGLSARILAAAPVAREPLLRQLWRALGGGRLAGPALACSLGLGLAFGLLATAPGGGEIDELEAWLALASLDTDFEEHLP